MKTDIEIQLTKLAEEAFNSHSINFEPLFPNVLVRLFQSEEQVTNSLIIRPQTAQQPNYRGVVVRTWKPFTTTVKGHTFEIKSEVQPGDIIISTYYAGVETGIENLNDAGYRVMSEGLDRDKNTGRVWSYAAGKDRINIFVKGTLYNARAAAQDILNMVEDDKTSSQIIADILDKYDIMPKLYRDVEKLSGENNKVQGS